MQLWWRLGALGSLTVVLACGGGVRETADSAEGGAGGGTTERIGGSGGSAGAPSAGTLRYDGALAFFRPKARAIRLIAATTEEELPPAGLGPGEWVELSAPIWPKVLELYQGEGANYPNTQAAREQLARDSALTFTTLLETCAPMQPDIVLRDPSDPPLSREQIATNYRLLEECAYRLFKAKPYWIPQLLADVDVCAQQLGAGWRIVGEADVLAMSAAEFELLRNILDEVSAGSGGFYFQLRVFTSRADGSIGGGDLDPAAGERLWPLSTSNGFAYDPRVHHEGGLALRCFRTTELQAN